MNNQRITKAHVSVVPFLVPDGLRSRVQIMMAQEGLLGLELTWSESSTLILVSICCRARPFYEKLPDCASWQPVDRFYSWQELWRQVSRVRGFELKPEELIGAFTARLTPGRRCYLTLPSKVKWRTRWQ